MDDKESTMIKINDELVEFDDIFEYFLNHGYVMYRYVDFKKFVDNYTEFIFDCTNGNIIKEIPIKNTDIVDPTIILNGKIVSDNVRFKK